MLLGIPGAYGADPAALNVGPVTKEAWLEPLAEPMP